MSIDSTDIPYIGPAYNISEMAWAIDVSRGVRSSSEKVKEQGEDWHKAVQDFTKLYFSSGKNGIDQQVLNEIFMAML